jgi:energy-coupling factor transporter ATP-binding protein EcfA2
METPLPLTKATTLKEALRQLDPERALSTPDELDAFFVRRDDSPVEDLMYLLDSTPQPQKFLFTGHRGSGKSTELAHLARLIGDRVTVVRYSVKRVLNLFDLSYVDVLLSLALQLMQEATRREVEVSPSILGRVQDFTRDITKEVEIGRQDGVEVGAEVGAELNFVAGKLSTKLRMEDVTREVVRETVQRRISDLLESIDVLGQGLREALGGRPVLAIIEDIDKADLDTAKRLFYEHTASLIEPPLTIIYTFPTPLRYDNTFIQVRSNFSGPLVLPNLKARRRSGEDDGRGLRIIRKILTCRLEDGLMDDDALDRMARLSSGIPRELIRLGRQAALEALKRGRETIDRDAVEHAAVRLRNDHDVLLDRDQRTRLRTIHEEKSINNDEAHRDLLHNLSVLEYRNGSVWYDVNPLVLPLLDDADDAPAEDHDGDAA